MGKLLFLLLFILFNSFWDRAIDNQIIIIILFLVIIFFLIKVAKEIFQEVIYQIKLYLGFQPKPPKRKGTKSELEKIATIEKFSKSLRKTLDELDQSNHPLNKKRGKKD